VFERGLALVGGGVTHCGYEDIARRNHTVDIPRAYGACALIRSELESDRVTLRSSPQAGQRTPGEVGDESLLAVELPRSPRYAKPPRA